MKILFVMSQYRVCERILPVVPKLKNDYELDCLLVYQMSSKHVWPGDKDLRDNFFKEYGDYFNKITENRDDLDYGEYKLIISDDNRDTPKTNLKDIYNKKNCLMIGCYHGAGELWNNFEFIKKSFGSVLDYCFVMGKSDVTSNVSIPIGIPSNDCLKSYKNLNKKHILVIVNFLGNRSCEFPVVLNKDFVEELDFVAIQKKFNLPIIFKLKSRADEGIGAHKRNSEYLNNILPKELNYEVLCDYEKIDNLIAESKLIISAPSTLAYKPIQLGIPTILIKGSGQLGNFGKFKGLVALDKQKIKDKINDMMGDSRHDEFIVDAIEGGLDFNSTEIFINKVKKLV
mgnify:FL=1